MMNTERPMKVTWFELWKAVRSAKTNGGASKRSSAQRRQEYKNHACSDEDHPRGGGQFRRQAACMHFTARRLDGSEGRSGRHYYRFRERSESRQQREERFGREVRHRPYPQGNAP